MVRIISTEALGYASGLSFYDREVDGCPIAEPSNFSPLVKRPKHRRLVEDNTPYPEQFDVEPFEGGQSCDGETALWD